MQDRDCGFLHAVNHDVGEWRKDEFARPFFAPQATTVREFDKLLNPLDNSAHGFQRRFGVVFGDALAYARGRLLLPESIGYSSS